jgi:hypothetical protein
MKLKLPFIQFPLALTLKSAFASLGKWLLFRNLELKRFKIEWRFSMKTYPVFEFFY